MLFIEIKTKYGKGYYSRFVNIERYSENPNNCVTFKNKHYAYKENAVQYS